MKSNVEIVFGAFADKLSKQVRDQGLRFKTMAQNVAHFQQDADAIVRLSVRGLLTDSEVRSARKRLLRKIAANVHHSPTGGRDEDT